MDTFKVTCDGSSLIYDVVEIDGIFYAIRRELDCPTGSLFEQSLWGIEDISGEFDLVDVIACCPDEAKLRWTVKRIFRDTVRYTGKRLKGLADGICYHISNSKNREAIDVKGLLPEYDSQFRLWIDRTIDGVCPENIPIGVAREHSVFLYPEISESLLVEKTQYRLADLYAVKVDPNRLWVAPSRLQDVFEFNYRKSEADKVDAYYDNVRKLAKEYWNDSVPAADALSIDSLLEYEALAYEPDSITGIERVGMFNSEGLFFPLSEFDFF